MANFIPKHMHAKAPNSESKVFNYISDDANTAEWNVFHSLGLAQRGFNKPYGEIDFVVLTSNSLICIEVKGGGVSCNNGEWQTINRAGVINKLKKSPFIQVRDGMHALRGEIIKSLGNNFSKLPCYTIVVFPDVECPPLNPEFKRDEVIDINDFSTISSKLFQEKITSQQKRLGFSNRLNGLSKQDILSLVEYLRPNFDIRISRSTKVRMDTEELIRLTKDQRKYLEGYIDNARCLVKGAAGTGKTTMAIEALKYKSGINDGTIGLFCFNKVLGGWLKREIDDLAISNVQVGSIYEQLLSIIKRSELSDEFNTEKEQVNDDEKLFRDLIPKYAKKAIIEINDPLECLILDEGQDLVRQELLDVFNVWLRGGLNNGNWIIFGDFYNQAIYSSGKRGDDLIELIDTNASYYANFRMSQNCRNTKKIANFITLLAGFTNPPYIVNQIIGDPVNIDYYISKDDLKYKICNLIRELIKDGLTRSEISILSTRKFADSAASLIDEFDIVDISNSSEIIPNNDSILFSTIHSFKGMESNVVILIDIDGIKGQYNNSILYIGMSRARACLFMFINENSRKDVNLTISKGIMETLENDE